MFFLVDQQKSLRSIDPVDMHGDIIKHRRCLLLVQGNITVFPIPFGRSGGWVGVCSGLLAAASGYL